jgi:hypothetical protein
MAPVNDVHLSDIAVRTDTLARRHIGNVDRSEGWQESTAKIYHRLAIPIREEAEMADFHKATRQNVQ